MDWVENRQLKRRGWGVQYCIYESFHIFHGSREGEQQLSLDCSRKKERKKVELVTVNFTLYMDYPSTPRARVIVLVDHNSRASMLVCVFVNRFFDQNYFNFNHIMSWKHFFWWFLCLIIKSWAFLLRKGSSWHFPFLFDVDLERLTSRRLVSRAWTISDNNEKQATGCSGFGTVENGETGSITSLNLCPRSNSLMNESIKTTWSALLFFAAPAQLRQPQIFVNMKLVGRRRGKHSHKRGGVKCKSSD